MPYILLSSATADREFTRSFTEYSTKDEVAKRLIDYFEEYLQDSQQMMGNNEEPNFEYACDDLFNFIDNFFGELVCLEKQNHPQDLWIPYSLSWVKETIYLYLRSQCENTEDKICETMENMEVDHNDIMIIG